MSSVAENSVSPVLARWRSLLGSETAETLRRASSHRAEMSGKRTDFWEIADCRQSLMMERMLTLRCSDENSVACMKQSHGVRFCQQGNVSQKKSLSHRTTTTACLIQIQLPTLDIGLLTKEQGPISVRLLPPHFACYSVSVNLHHHASSGKTEERWRDVSIRPSCCE